MIAAELAAQYFGPPPYYRNTATGQVEPLPHRIRLPDGSTRTDPSQWLEEPGILDLIGFALTDVTQADIDTKKPPFDIFRQQALQQLDDIWRSTIQSGWQTPMGWSLGLDISDVTLLTGAFLLLKESVALGLSTTIDIIDIDGHPHTLDLPTFTQIMLAYGQHRSTLSAADATIRAQLKVATTEEELAAAFLPLQPTDPPVNGES